MNFDQPAGDKLLTLLVSAPSLASMDVPLNPDLQAKLSRLAAQQGRASEALVVEAVERLVNYDEWFLREVDKGLADADRGELVDHADVRKMINERYPG
jgi:predicted transcriptional regulator